MVFAECRGISYANLLSEGEQWLSSEKGAIFPPYYRSKMNIKLLEEEGRDEYEAFLKSLSRALSTLSAYSELL